MHKQFERLTGTTDKNPENIATGHYTISGHQRIQAPQTLHYNLSLELCEIN